MSYTPKSKYIVRQTSGREYVYPSSGQDYIGPIIITSEGVFAGNDITNKGPKLNSVNTKPISNTIMNVNTILYNNANREAMLENFENFKPIIPTKVKPTEDDYKIGYYVRYFAVKSNDYNTCFEVNKETYNGIFFQNRDYNWALYRVGRLRWAIDGDILKANQSILTQKEKKFPFISRLFPKLNEFQKVRYTKGNELTYLDNTEYIGPYHLHLGKPMEGLFHSNIPHKKLKFIKQNTLTDISSGLINISENNYIIPDKIEKKVTNIVQESSTLDTPSTPNIPSSGGGSGY